MAQNNLVLRLLQNSLSNNITKFALWYCKSIIKTFQKLLFYSSLVCIAAWFKKRWTRSRFQIRICFSELKSRRFCIGQKDHRKEKNILSVLKKSKDVKASPLSWRSKLKSQQLKLLFLSLKNDKKYSPLF